jgi:MFS superfamily sulfate permease-like transporter
VNRSAGARTQVAGLVTAAAAVATLVLLAPLMGLMPQATLSAVVIVYSIGLIQLAEFLDILFSAAWSSFGPWRPSPGWCCSGPSRGS